MTATVNIKDDKGNWIKIDALKDTPQDTGWMVLSDPRQEDTDNDSFFVEYRKIDKVVHLRGYFGFWDDFSQSICQKTNVIATLPEGFRPKNSFSSHDIFGFYSSTLVFTGISIDNGEIVGEAYSSKTFGNMGADDKRAYFECSFVVD